MPSHIHLLIYIDGNLLAGFMRDFKKFVAQKVATDLGIVSNAIWMSRYDRVAIYSEEVLVIKLNYIHNNPVRAELCGLAEEWPWSSAKDYMSEQAGPVPIWEDWT